MIPNTIMGINSSGPPNLTTTTTSSSDPSSFPCSSPNKRKRRPAGTPDPDAEVVSLSPKTLLESDRYVCEICNQGFQRDQNLQMHRRRHKVPWKLLKRERDNGDPASSASRKRVYVCPEPSCLHHDPGHALGDLVGIKKHFRRKHSDRRQWVCERCGKGYAVQSDYKAHLKTCGTRGHSCDCGRVFSRVESFIEHQDACTMGHLKTSSIDNNDCPQKSKPQCLSRATASSPSPCGDTNNGSANNAKSPGSWWPPLPPLSLQPINLPKPINIFKSYLAAEKTGVSVAPTVADDFHNLDLQLSSSSSPSHGAKIPTPTKKDERFFPPRSTRLRLSIGMYDPGETDGVEKPSLTREGIVPSLEASAAATEKAYADEARRQARRQIELAERELADAKRMRKQVQAELEKARAIKERARDQIKSVVLEITCNTCKKRIQGKELEAAAALLAPEENSLVLSYVSSAITEGEVDDHNGVQMQEDQNL